MEPYEIASLKILSLYMWYLKFCQALMDLFINVYMYMCIYITPLKRSFYNQEERKIENFMKSRNFAV